MYMSPELIRYLQQLNHYLHQQNQHIHQMNTRIQQLIEDVNQLKEKSNKPQEIRNEYKFDLLKIERLDGTLNIGIKPDGNGADSSIEEFAVGQSLDTPSLLEKQYPQLYQKIQKQIGDYLDHDSFSSLKKLENQYQYPLDEPYRKFIVDDVKKQINKRISYYLNEMKSEEMIPEDVEKMRQPIIDNVIRDIEKTFETFIRNLPKKEHD
jgi:spore germination protein PC